MKRIFLIAATASLLSQATLVSADQRPDPPPGLAELFVNGCHFFVEEAFLQKHPRYAWTWAGSCKGEYAEGQGTMRVYDESRNLVSETVGKMSKGKFEKTSNVSAPNQQKPQGGGWDSWLEATGNKTKVAPPTAPSAVKTTGSAPASVEATIKACQHLVNVTGPGKPGIGAIFAIDYLAPVDASTVYGNMGPQGKLVPLKLYARYRDGEKMYANGYLQKDPFGEFKCIQAR